MGRQSRGPPLPCRELCRGYPDHPLALLTGPIGLVALFSKKKNHFVTIEFNRNPVTAKAERADFRANPQYVPMGDIVIFQVNKHDYKTVVELLQVKTGIHATMPPKAKWNNG
ncbi:MAG: hypothetical protein ACRD2E_03015 [Terriglobales bacterium]